MTRFLCVAVAASLIASDVSAEVESGPKAGEKIEPLKAFGVVGTVEGKEADFAAERKDAPTVYLFVKPGSWSRPMARFTKVLDDKLADADGAAAVAVWMGDEEKSKEYLPKANQSLKYARTSLAVFTGDANGPNGWGINADADLTVVVAKKGKVIKTFVYGSVNDTDVKKVIEAIGK